MCIFWKCSNYAEYILKCTIAGVEPLFTESEFLEIQDQKTVNLGHRFGMHPSDMFNDMIDIDDDSFIL